MQSILRWAGSKRYLLPTLISRLPSSYKRYVEPFCGSASLFFAVEPKKAVLNDANYELISLYRTIKEKYEDIYEILKVLDINKDVYYKIRALNSGDLSDIQNAARFLYLNKYCFNGLYRTNKCGQFNVPFSGVKNGKCIDLDVLKNSSLVLSGAKLYSEDFGLFLNKVRKDDFVYIDPPYATNEIRTFCEYGPNIFKTTDLVRLAKGLEEIDKRGAFFLLSYSVCAESEIAFSQWLRSDLKVKRNIAGFAGHRKEVKEYLFSNY